LTTADVVAGLAQVSGQIQGLAGYLLAVTTVTTTLLVFCVVLLFVNGRVR